MIVLDSSFLVAYHNERDVHHEAATKTMADFIAGTWGRGLLLERADPPPILLAADSGADSVTSRVTSTLYGEPAGRRDVQVVEWYAFEGTVPVGRKVPWPGTFQYFVYVTSRAAGKISPIRCVGKQARILFSGA